MHHSCDESGPPGLVARAEAGAVITMKIFVEENMVAPQWVFLKLFCSSEYWPVSVGITEECLGQTVRYLTCYLEKCHHLPGTRRTLYAETLSVVEVKVQEGPYYQRIYWHPDRSPPV